MYGNRPERWSDHLTGWDRLRFIINCFTRLRYCDEHGRLALREKGAPGTQPPPYRPWFEIPGRRSTGSNVVFGHWSTLGPHTAPGIYGIDTGCLWGGHLTALRLDGPVRERLSVACPGARTPGP
jgi:bis(5'-nucleosyl)-tetraphosphatase (symmetrical)